MLPYNRMLVRCDPLFSMLNVDEAQEPCLSIGSHRLTSWRCSVCDSKFQATVKNMYVSRGRCPEHSRQMKGPHRAKYGGDVPRALLRPIRAGILQSIDTDVLIALIATLEPLPSKATGADDPAAALTMARLHVESIVTGNHTRVQLLDSVFWGDVQSNRADGHVYVRSQHPKKDTKGDDTIPHLSTPAIAIGCIVDVERNTVVSGENAALVPHPDYVLVDPPQLCEWNILATYETTHAPDDLSALDRECSRYLQQIRYKLFAHWTDYALSFLQVPVPIGNRVLCREHAVYCYMVLASLYKHYPDVAHGGFAGEIKVLRSVAELLNISTIHPYFLRCILDAIQTIDRAAGLV